MGDQADGLLSPLLRRMRIRAVRPHLRGSVLDYGCGTAYLSRRVEPSLYTGVDADAESVDKAKRLHPRASVRTLGAFSASSATFDTIAMLAVIEHVSQPEELLALMRKKLNPGGRIVLTTPHPLAHIIHRAGSRIGIFSRSAAEEHETLLDRASMRVAARRAGLRVVLEKRFMLGMNQLFILEAGDEGD